TGSVAESMSGSSSSAGTFADLEKSQTGSYSSSYSSQDSGTLNSLGTTTVHVRSNDTSSYHAEGLFSFGAYSLSSMVLRDNSTSTDTVAYVGTLSFDGSGSSTSSQSNTGAATGSTGLAQGGSSGNASSFNSSSYSISLRSASDVTVVVADVYAEYEAG